jgi:hypothetical protein
MRSPRGGPLGLPPEKGPWHRPAQRSYVNQSYSMKLQTSRSHIQLNMRTETCTCCYVLDQHHCERLAKLDRALQSSTRRMQRCAKWRTTSDVRSSRRAAAGVAPAGTTLAPSCQAGPRSNTQKRALDTAHLANACPVRTCLTACTVNHWRSLILQSRTLQMPLCVKLNNYKRCSVLAVGRHRSSSWRRRSNDGTVLSRGEHTRRHLAKHTLRNMHIVPNRQQGQKQR